MGKIPPSVIQSWTFGFMLAGLLLMATLVYLGVPNA